MSARFRASDFGFRIPSGFAFGLLLLGLLLGAPGLVLADTNAFRFAFLSDTHVGSSTGAEDLRASVRDLNSITGLSFVVISGDITEYGSLEQLRLARQILAELKLPCHLIPGNHDTKWSESGATDFSRLWGQDRFEFQCGGYRFIGLHEGPVMKMGDGHWAPQDVRWLRQTLEKLPDPRQPLIFVTHYPIDDGIANWYVVLDLLKQYNLQAVLCGHGHANHALNFEGVPGVMGRSNLRAGAAVGGFNLVAVEDGAMTFRERRAETETKPAWHCLRLEKHDYASDKNQYPRPDFSVNARYPAVRERWKFESGFTMASSPALWKGLALVGDASGVFRALELKTGRVRWKFQTDNAVYSTPAADAGLVVFASTDGSVYALKAATGQLVWRFKTDRPIVASPAIAAGRVFIGSSEGRFRALALHTGELVWQFDRLNGFVETKPLVFRDEVLFGAWDQFFYALDSHTGKLRWQWRGDQPGVLYSPAACWPIAAKGKVFLVAPDRKMTALDAVTGRQLWRTGNYMVRESLGLSADQSRFYVRAMRDFFYAFSTAADHPEKRWELNAHFGYDINSAMLVERDGVLFYGTKNGLLLALEAATGAIRWEHKIGVGIVNTLAPLSASKVLATDFDGNVVLLEAAAP